MTMNFRWPLYEIRAYNKLWEDNGVLYIQTTSNIEYVIDNKNIHGKTLGIRRLRIKADPEVKLYNLKRICYTFYDVLTSKYKLFIDSDGQLVSIKKKHRRTLVYREVLQTEIIGTKVLCICKGIFKPIEIPFIPNIMPRYLGLLIINKQHYLYELSQEQKADTWRLF